MEEKDIQIDAGLFGELIDAAPDPIVIVRDDGRIAIVNAEAIRKFGYSRDELLGKPIEVIVPARFRHLHADQRVDYSRSPRVRPMGSSVDMYAARKDGSEFPVEISLSPLRLTHGILIISIIRDITERKRAERALREKAEELARSNADLEQFAYVASHDLQEPLRAIASSCQLLQRRYGDKFDDDANSYFDYAVNGAKRLQELIVDLLDYSRVSTKGKPFAPCDCETILSKVLANLRTQIEEATAAVTHDPLPGITADAPQINRLFQNLISNAIKFRGVSAPRIHVTSTKDSDQWIFSVRDNGIGIDPKYFDQIFVIFRRLHARDRYPGTGIGLAICKKIVDRHGGKIWVASTPDVGSAFSFSIPFDASSRGNDGIC